MESGRGSSGGLRSGPGGKKMRKRKELDALVGAGKRSSKRPGSGGVSPQDQLLSESTGDDEYWGSKPAKPERRHYTPPSKPSHPCYTLVRFCTVLLVMACLVATLIVMWLFIDIREQTTYLHNQLDQVAAGSQGVPDALQKCHSLSRDLQNNQSKLFAQLTEMSQNLSTFTSQMAQVKSGLRNVEEKLNASPELVNVPHDLQALSVSVASFGSQIQDLQTTSSHLKEEHSNILEAIKKLQLNISGLHGSVEDLSKTAHIIANQGPVRPEEVDQQKKLEDIVNSLKVNLTNINNTLSRRLVWTNDDEHKDHKFIIELQDASANLSSRLTTLQNECTSQFSKLQSVSSNVYNYSLQMAGYNKRIEDVNKQLTVLYDQFRKLENTTYSIGNELASYRVLFHETPDPSNSTAYDRNVEH